MRNELVYWKLEKIVSTHVTCFIYSNKEYYLDNRHIYKSIADR